MLRCAKAKRNMYHARNLQAGNTYGVNAWKLLRKLHNHTDNERCSQSRATYELCHRYSRFGLLSSFLGSHFFDVFFHLVTGSQPPQSFTGFFLPLFRNEQISRAEDQKREEAVIVGRNGKVEGVCACARVCVCGGGGEKGWNNDRPVRAKLNNKISEHIAKVYRG